MKYREKIVQIEFLDDEERVIRRLQAVYNQSLKDITQKANALQEEIYKIQDKYNSIEDEQERETLKSMERSKVYQKQYQDALKTQVRGILDKMHQKEFKTVNEYLNECYDKSFTGNMYVLHGEGIPLIVPIDQEKVVRAVQINSKINKGLYSRLGEDVDLLKRKITAQISRGVATGMSYSQMAQQLAGYTKIGYNNAVRITRTEGHRIQQESTMDACYAARERGADVVKQWDATMDANTRESHQMVDGEIRALDEKFSNGLMYPGDPEGSAAEVINCRCILLQRAKWALDQKELDRLKERASFYGLDKTKSFDEFNKKYIGTVENSKGNKIKMDLQFFAKIPDEKLTEYALNFEHPIGKEKAKAFKEALGYTKESYTDLKTKILDSFDEKELVYKREDKYGKRYEQIMQITGPNGKTANVLTAWIKDNDNAEPRLTSIYVDKR
nr:MAG TPA: minor capsid protein [Caudoviricetes sp.]